MKEMSISVVGLVWYQAEHYAAVKALMKDGDRLPPTYADWRRQAEQAERTVSGKGQLVVRANLEPEAFRQFCLDRGLDVDAKGRMQFANWVAIQHHRKGG